MAGRLEALGYVNRGEQGIPGRFAFRQTSGFIALTIARNSWMEYHLYVCYANSIALKNHLVFRDALLHVKMRADEYSLLLQMLFNDIHISHMEYTSRKTSFIHSVLPGCGIEESILQRICHANLR